MNNFLNTVPKPVRITAGILCGLAVLTTVTAAILSWTRSESLLTGTLASLVIGPAAGIVIAVWILCLGYVYADARRRSMPPVLWTLIAALIPNLLGFLLYFALRRPIGVPCARCGRPVAADQRFCSWCGYEAAPFAQPPVQPNIGPSSAV